jgi:acyl-CoA hydrolase
MKSKRLVAALSGAAMTLAGCATQISEGRYDEVRTKLQTSAAYRKAETARCVQVFSRMPRAELEANALIFRIPVGKFNNTVCTRLVEGVRSGRLSHKSINDFMANRDYKDVVLVVIGR